MKSPAYQHYAADFLSDLNVATMTMEQRGVYITLLDHDWIEGGIPADSEFLKGGLTTVQPWNEVWLKVGRCFVEKDGRFYNPRLEKERQKQEEWREKSRQGGINSGISRGYKTKGGSTVVEPKANRPVEPLANSLSSSSSPIKTPIVPQGDGQGDFQLQPQSPPSPPTKVNGDWKPSAIQLRLNRLFNRQPSTRWSEKEIKSLAKASPISESDLQVLENYYSASIPDKSDFRRRDLATLLNNFPGEVDRARNYRPVSEFGG